MEEFNFSIDSPSPNSHWTYTRLHDIQGSKDTAFVVAVSADTKLVITILDISGVMDPGRFREFVDGMKESLPKDWSVGDTKMETSVFPLKDSSKFRIAIRLPNKATMYAYGYIVTGSTTYIFQDYSLETAEPPQFKHFVGSFAFLKSPKAGTPLWFYALFAGIILVCQGIPIWISVKAKPLADKPYRWGTYVGIIFGLLGIMLLLITFSATDEYGKIVGCIVGLCAILCCIGILGRRKFGVVMFVIAYLTLIMGSAYLDVVRNRHVTSQQQGQAFPNLVLFVVTTIYFKKRWSLMGTQGPQCRRHPQAPEGVTHSVP